MHALPEKLPARPCAPFATVMPPRPTTDPGLSLPQSSLTSPCAPDHDASVVSELTGSTALAGMFCAGELGPIGGRTFLHGFTASMALFRRRP